MNLKEQINSLGIFTALLILFCALTTIYTISAQNSYENLRVEGSKIVLDYVKLKDTVNNILSGEFSQGQGNIEASIKKVADRINLFQDLDLSQDILKEILDSRLLLTSLQLHMNKLRGELNVALIDEEPKTEAQNSLRMAAIYDLTRLEDKIFSFSEYCSSYAARMQTLSRNILLALFSFVIFILLIALVMFERNLAQPVIELIAQTKEVKNGKRENVSLHGKAAEIRELFFSIRSIVEAKHSAMELLERRNSLLSLVNEVSVDALHATDSEVLMRNVCNAFIKHRDYCMAWTGALDEESGLLVPVHAAFSPAFSCNLDTVRQMSLFVDIEANPAVKASTTFKSVVLNHIPEMFHLPQLRQEAVNRGFTACASWPILWKKRFYGTLTVYSSWKAGFTEEEVELLTNMVSDISLGLYSIETNKHLSIERDLNREIIDAVNALMVSVAQCGEIISFNSRAEEVTGLSREDVMGKYWVDVMVEAEKRKELQQLFSNFLQQNRTQMNFQTEIFDTNGDKHIITWHGSVLPDVRKGILGLVFIGIDITSHVKTDQALEQAIADWEHIFSAIQDPALIVNSEGMILEANSATCSAAKKKRANIIGQKVCAIMHGGKSEGNRCTLEEVIESGKSRIMETELKGLNGHYMVTVSPVAGTTEKNDRRVLMLARDLTEEKIQKAEALRAAHLAAIGELAAGVAHEINNPINGIINYAQLVLDEDMDSSLHNDLLERIIKESNRIAVIVSNLLSFSRQKESEETNEINLHELVQDSISLIGHQLQKDGIMLKVDVPQDLPLINGHFQQLQQVLLNLLSNARYALNRRYPDHVPEKRIEVKALISGKNDKRKVILTVKDWGTGISQDILDRLFEPFFSTKPEGEGTGLGLSISHGLISEHGGSLKVDTIHGEYTSMIVELPVAE